jgi:TonB family protein
MRNVVHRLTLFLVLGVCCRADLTLRYTVETKIGSGAPSALAKTLEQQMAATPPQGRSIRIKGDKTLSKVGALMAIIDNSTSAITLLNAATKQYAQVSSAEVIDGLRASLPAAPAALLKNMKFDVQTSKTGQFAMFSGMRAEEHLMAITVSMDVPGTPEGPLIRMETHTWLANPDELNRIPALRQYAVTAQRAMNVGAAGDAMEKLFEQLPGVAEKMRVLTDEAASNAGSLAMKIQAALYIPKADPNAPMLTMTTDLAEISSDPIDDSVFAVPPDFQLAAPAELVKALTPARAAPAPQNLAPGEQISRVGGGVSAPSVIYKRDPEYTKEALRAKLEGTVTLNIVVDKEGTPRNIQIVQPLGLGLDEKAIETVSQWKFRPGQKDGQPVNVAAMIKVSFKLLADPPQR